MTKNKNKKNCRSAGLNQADACLDLATKIAAGLLLAIIAAFVFNINDLSIKSFILRDLRAEADRLSLENEEAELAVMRLESYEHIALRARALNMVKVDNIEYLNAAGIAVARK